MRVTAPVAAVALLLLATPVRAADSGELCVVVVRTEQVSRAHADAARAALATSLTAQGAKILGEPITSDLAKLAVGACDEQCFQLMRANLDRGELVLGRLSASSTHFALRVSMGTQELGAAGPLNQLEEASKRLARRLLATESTLLITGGRSPEFHVDGVRVEPKANGEVLVSPGRHVVRVGQGVGPRAMTVVDAPAGETIAIAFPATVDGLPPGAPRGPVTKAPIASVPGGPPRATRTGIPGATIATGLAIASRERVVTGADGGGFTASFVGTGPRFSLELEQAPGLVESFEASWITFDPSRATFDFGPQGEQSASGGTTLLAQVAAGFRTRIGSSISVTPSIGFAFEQHTARDPKGPSGQLDVLTSFNRMALLAGAAAGFHFDPLVVTAGFFAAPWSSWKETPNGAMGSSAKTDLALSWRAGLGFSASPRLAFALDYAGEKRGVSYSGNATAPLTPLLRDTKVRETMHSGMIGVSYAF